MANQYDDDYDFEDEVQDSSGPANLRKALKKAEKDRAALQEQLAAVKNNLRERSVRDVLETKGVNSKIAKFIPSDVEAPEQIAAWLDENADVFGFRTNEQSEPTELSQDAITEQRINTSASTGITPGRDEDLANRIASAQTKEELMSLMGIVGLGRNR
jgi:exoribonuclease R